MRNNLHILFSSTLALFVILNAHTQEVTSDSSELFDAGSFPKKFENGLNNLSVSGNYRFLANYTSMETQYPEFGTVPGRLFIGDDSQIPQLYMTIGARPSAQTSFSTDLFLWTPLSGSTADYAKGLNLGVNLNGSHSTKFGNFSVRMGGIHWYTLTPMTFATNTGYNRFSLFERNPWDPNSKDVLDRYSKFYNDGALSQDERWGQQAFQGFIFEGMKLPKDFSFSYMYGKSQFNGGALPKPNNMMAGKIRKDFNIGFFSFNGISSKTYDDSLTRETIGYELYTYEFAIKLKKIHFLAENGIGRYTSPDNKGKWGQALDLKFQFQKE